jgi:hypothetical protein
VFAFSEDLLGKLALGYIDDDGYATGRLATVITNKGDAGLCPENPTVLPDIAFLELD